MAKTIPTPVDRPTTALLAIDPGIAGTGWALWRSVNDSFPDRHHIAPDEVGVLQKRFESFVDASDWLANQLADRCFSQCRFRCAAHHTHTCGCGPQPNLIVVCEFPEFQTGAHRSMGWMRGDLQKLTYLVGVFGRTFHNKNRSVSRSTFEPIPVHQWKGQLPKSVVESRITQHLGRDVCKNLDIRTHAWDAVGIGLWRLGVFK